MKSFTIIAASVGLAALAACQAKTDENADETLQANTLVVDNLDVGTDNMSDMNAMTDMNATIDNTTTTTTNTTTTNTTNSY